MRGCWPLAEIEQLNKSTISDFDIFVILTWKRNIVNNPEHETYIRERVKHGGQSSMCQLQIKHDRHSSEMF